MSAALTALVRRVRVELIHRGLRSRRTPTLYARGDWLYYRNGNGAVVRIG